MQEPQAHTNVYDLKLWRQFWKLTRMYWFSEEKWQARGILALLVLLLGLFSSINILFSYVGRDFTTALAEKDLSGFYHALLLTLGVIVFAAPITAFFTFIQQKLFINWRLWLTSHFLGNYFKIRAYYHINHDALIDNPDQRIAVDINGFTSGNLNLFIILANALIQFFSFVLILWTISVKLVLVLLAYAVFGTLVSIFLGKRLLNLNFQKLRLEADFRYGLIHVRDNVESIAFYQGEEREESQVRRRLHKLIANNLLLIGWERNLAVFTSAYNYIPMFVLPFVVLAPDYFSGQIKLGVLMQAQGACAAVLAALAVIVTNFSMISSIAAGITRVETFATALAQQSAGKQLAGCSTIESKEASRLALANVTLQTPNYQQTLLRDATAEVPPGRGMLIVGPSGAGKSSLLRAIAGLWGAGEGQIFRPALNEMFFLPQRPYMVLGSLRQQLLYPNMKREASDDELRAMLANVNLTNLPERFGGFDEVMDWGTLLSLGEQQRLAFARLLLARPRYAVLDEATSALDVPNEARLYRQLQETGTTFVSVGHRPSLINYHDKILELLGGASWRFMPATEFVAATEGA